MFCFWNRLISLDSATNAIWWFRKWSINYIETDDLNVYRKKSLHTHEMSNDWHFCHTLRCLPMYACADMRAYVLVCICEYERIEHDIDFDVHSCEFFWTIICRCTWLKKKNLKFNFRLLTIKCKWNSILHLEFFFVEFRSEVIAFEEEI